MTLHYLPRAIQPTTVPVHSHAELTTLTNRQLTNLSIDLVNLSLQRNALTPQQYRTVLRELRAVRRHQRARIQQDYAHRRAQIA